MSKIRIATLIWKDGYGGAERSLADLAAAIDQSRFEMRFFFLSGEGGPFSKQIISLGFKVIYLKWSGAFSLRGRLRLIRELRKFDPMIIHDHILPPLTRPIVKLAMHRPIITTEHGNAMGHIRKHRVLWRHILERFDLLFCDQILANSYASLDAVHQVYKFPVAKIKVLYLGINLQQFKLKLTHSSTMVTRRIGYVGRISNTHKGVDFIPHVARGLLDRGVQDIEFIIIGDGPDRKNLEILCNKFGVFQLFTFLGFCRDIESILPSLDVLLMPSRYEPFGLSAIEALAAGVPVVGFDVDGLNEAVGNCQNSILVPPGDVNAMVGAVIFFLNTSKSYSVAGRRYVAKHFSNQRMALDLQHAYESLVI
jgi:glycosyltransferase involved in cell wall biosynthesis